MSKSARAKIAAAQRARWAAQKKQQAQPAKTAEPAKPTKRKMSAAGLKGAVPAGIREAVQSGFPPMGPGARGRLQLEDCSLAAGAANGGSPVQLSARAQEDPRAWLPVAGAEVVEFDTPAWPTLIV